MNCFTFSCPLKFACNVLIEVCVVFLLWIEPCCTFLAKVYVIRENNPGSLSEGALLAAGGRYDYLLHQLWGPEYVSYYEKNL